MTNLVENQLHKFSNEKATSIDERVESSSANTNVFSVQDIIEKVKSYSATSNTNEIEKESFDKDIEEKKEKYSQLAEAKDKGSAKLYISLSNLLSIMSYVVAISIIIMIISTFILHYKIIFDPNIDISKANLVIDKIENLF